MASQSAATLGFELVSPEKTLVSEDITMVVIPAADGDMGVLPDHAPMIVELKSGIVDIFQGDKIAQKLFVSSGFANIHSTGCTVMADEGIHVENIDPSEVEEYVQQVMAEIEKTIEPDEREELEHNLAIARAKIEILKKISNITIPHR